VFLTIVIGVQLFKATPLNQQQRTLPEGTYVLQADWQAIQATVSYSVQNFNPKPFLVDDERWQIQVKAKPGDLITILVKPHLPGKQFKTNCYIRNRFWTVIGEDHSPWDKNGGQVLCSVIAK